MQELKLHKASALILFLSHSLLRGIFDNRRPETNARRENFLAAVKQIMPPAARSRDIYEAQGIVLKWEH